MADQNKLLIEIVLDDGSVKQGFATIKQEAKKAGKEASKGFESFGDVFDAKPISLLNDRIRQLPVSIGVAAAGFTALGFTIKKAFDLTLAGEQIKTIENSFKALADNAGISATALQSGLEGAANGLADTTDLLDAANQSLGALGKNAAELPKTLDLARKASVLFGGSLVDNFQTINQAIITGNERSLRQVKIFADLDGAVKAYAQSVGLSVEALTEEEKQQARLNAILEAGQKGFKGVDESSRQATNAFIAFKNASNDLIELTQVAASNAFGGAFANFFNKIGGDLRDLSNSFKAQESSAAGAAAQASLYAAELRRIEAILSSNQLSGTDPIVKRYQDRADALRELLKVQAQEELSRRDPAEDPSQRARLFAEQDAKLADLQKRQGEERKKQREKDLQVELAFDQALTQAQSQSEQARYDAMIARGSEIEQLEAQSAQKATQIEYDRQQALLNIQKQFGNSKIISLDEVRALQAATNKVYDEQELAAAAEFDAKKKELAEKSNKALIQIGQIANQSLASAVSQGVSAIGASLVKGENAFDAFGKTILGILGDMLIQIGTAIVTASTAIEALSTALKTGFGGAGIAGGLALIALGGALKTLSGGLGGLGGSSSSVDVGGGIAVQPSTDLIDGEATTVERAPSTEVVVNIQGDVLDSDDSGIRIVDIINSAFDKQGVKIRRGVVA